VIQLSRIIDRAPRDIQIPPTGIATKLARIATN
jgi:hypothetical protein